MESILTSIKKLLGPEEDYDNFDTDIIIHINSAFSDLHQIGVGPTEGFMIEDDSAVWTDFIPDISKYKLQSVKTYIYLKVKLVFDNATLSSSVIASMERQIKEYEWRLNTAVETTV